jgi:hypothetical protein
LQSPSHKSYSHNRDFPALAALLLATALFAVTIWFAQATFSSKATEWTKRLFNHVFKTSIGDTLTILVILSGLMSLVVGYVTDNMLESIQWSLTSRSEGVDMLTILGLSPTTGAFGTAAILFGKQSKVKDRVWAASKSVLLHWSFP